MDVEDALILIDKIDHIMSSRQPAQIISPDVFATLDNLNASRNAIESIGPKISQEICLRLTAIANAVYLGTLRRGNICSFYDVVNCLGLEKTKALIIMFNHYFQGGHDPEIETIFARSYATSIMAMIIAMQSGFREDVVKKAEICGLYMEIGRKIMVLYKKLYADDAQAMTEDFIDTYHPYLGEKLATRYELPDYIRKVILARNVIFEEYHISIAGIVQLAHDTVENSFRKYQNRLVIKCQVPRPATDVTRTLEAIITDKFKAVGLENYLHIIRIPRIYDI